jgi:hypothetical protein
MSCKFKEQSKIVRTGGIPLWGRGALSQAKPPSTPRGKCANAGRGRDFQTRTWDAENGGGGKKRETMPFVNRLTDQLQTQNQYSQYYSSPFLY